MHDDHGALTTALGWASLGLGAFQTLAPGAFLRVLGAQDDAKGRAITVGASGVRELGAAAGILAVERPRPVRTLWARVGGDVLDLTLVARALRHRPERPERLVGALVATVGITAADVVAALSNSRTRSPNEVPPMQKQAATTVRCSAPTAQRQWRELATRPDGPFRLGPVEILEEEPGRRVAWRTTDGTKTSGVIVFTPAPGDRGTELHLDLAYDVTGGAVGEAVQKLKGDEPLEQAKDDLRRFKQIVETGEVVRSDGTPGGPSAREQMRQRPAQPVEHVNA